MTALCNLDGTITETLVSGVSHVFKEGGVAQVVDRGHLTAGVVKLDLGPAA